MGKSRFFQTLDFPFSERPPDSFDIFSIMSSFRASHVIFWDGEGKDKEATAVAKV